MTSVAASVRAPEGSRWSVLAKPHVRTLALAAAMAAVGGALAVYGVQWPRPASSVSLSWWEIVPAVVLADELGFHLEVKGEAHTFTLSELPLVVGCLFAAPWALLLGRLIGDVFVQLVRWKQRGLKLIFNVANFLLETAVLIVVFHFLVGGRSATDWVSWPLILVALAAADLVSMCTVSLAIRWHGGKPRLSSTVMAAGATALVNVNLGLLAAVLLARSALALVLLGVVLAITSMAYRGYADLSKRYSSLKLLYDFTKAVGAHMSGEAVLDHMLGRARDLLSAEVAEVVLFDSGTGYPTLRQRSTEAAPQGNVVRLPADAEDVNWPQLVSDGHAMVVAKTERSPAQVALRRQLGVRDFIVAPLWANDAVVGALMVANRVGAVSSFDRSDCRLFETLANHASIAFENSQLVYRLRQEAEDRRREALHDALTGLANRKLFSQQVDDAVGNGGAVLLMDLDRFKEINDTLGHHNGDELLCKVANRLVSTLGDDGIASRFGGDEFAVLLPHVTDAAGAESITSRLVDSLRKPFTVSGLTLQVDASVGIAMAPEHGADATRLLQKADVAMYHAKISRSGLALYSPDQDNYSPQRLKLQGELGAALDSGQILVFFQPQAQVVSSKVVSAEALVRWRHPELGLIGPDEFIPGAEQNGLIGPLTEHVLHMALRQCAEWRRNGYNIGVSVNLAVRSLLDVNLPRQIGEMLGQYDVPADMLTLEITESSVMADPHRAIAVLDRLAPSGVRLSVDDFGTGYSSLSYLQQLPVHEVKVDKSFVFRMSSERRDSTIVQTIIELGHHLGLTVVAEGVEDQISWDRLRAMSCDLAQGYHLSKPVPAGIVTQWLEEREEAEPALAGAAVAGDAGGLPRGGRPPQRHQNVPLL